ncbi:PKD domain-containing protein [Patescibacteria group bacterium]|nr:PKD domain-containing protein [Patescibacteria group bacterium]
MLKKQKIILFLVVSLISLSFLLGYGEKTEGAYVTRENCYWIYACDIKWCRSGYPNLCADCGGGDCQRSGCGGPAGFYTKVYQNSCTGSQYCVNMPLPSLGTRSTCYYISYWYCSGSTPVAVWGSVSGSSCSDAGQPNCCSVSSWSPDPSTVCSGTPFTQTSNCGNTRTAYGSKTCCVAGYGNSCTSAANVCGQTNTGTIQCNGSCSAATPPNSNCLYTVSTVGGAGGTISSASRTVSYGNTATFTITSNAGYLASASGCGGTLAGTTYTTGAITSVCTATATFTAKTLSVSLSVAPSSGNSPLTATLTATVAGTAQGTINYTFYCNRDDDGTNITLPADGKYDGQPATTQAHDCVYSIAGTFSPKVIVERDNGVPSATDKKTVTVFSQPPTAINLSITPPNYCVAGPAATFSWTFSDPDAGDTQGAYQVQVATNPGFSGPGTVIDSGKVSSASNSYATISGILAYNDTYYWRLMVWDDNNTASSWVAGSSFTTPKHAYPTADFSWAPLYPSVNETVLFVDQSTVFGGAIKSAWSWTFQDGSPASSAQPDPIVEFLSNGTKQVVLQITDSDGFVCSSLNKTAGVRLPLPNWKEVAP